MQPSVGSVRTCTGTKEAEKIGTQSLCALHLFFQGKPCRLYLMIKHLHSICMACRFLYGRISVVMTKFLADSTDCDFDGVAKKESDLSAISEHVESGGASGDSSIGATC